MTRPGLAAVLCCVLLSGCGFRPLYLPDGGRGSVAANELSAIYVPVMVERSGQLMRQALQRRVEGSGTGIAKKYDLIAQPAISGEGIALQRDNSTTRVRLNGNVLWTLRKLDLAHTIVATGTARVVDGYNVLNQQYFAADLENESAQLRVVESLADQVVLQVAVFFRRQESTPGQVPATTTGPLPASTAIPEIDSVPGVAPAAGVPGLAPGL